MIAARCRACPPNRTRVQGLDAGALLRPGLRLHDHAADQDLADDTSPLGFAQVVIMLFVILWMYFGYVWLTNAVPPNTTVRRLLLIAGMGGFLVIALAIPNAFGAAGIAFGVGYLIVNLVHSGLFISAGGPGSAAAMARLAPFNLGSAGLVFAGGFLPSTWRAVAWSAAVVLMIVSPYVNRRHGEFRIRPAHFVERHGLVVIIAIGIGAAGLPLNLELVVAALLGLALAYQLWWCHFGGEQDLRAEHSLAAMAPSDRARAALSAFGWAHAPLLLGIVVVCVGVKRPSGTPPSTSAEPWRSAVEPRSSSPGRSTSGGG
ncbi:hypothetical protein GCM10022267_50300 [Lentzea roselyniae]|uniref:Uncharacterized protein n=1 Tax=Lentzea roselyniae TaxID=531940 RepID=A0ABP7BG04_9PSEU